MHSLFNSMPVPRAPAGEAHFVWVFVGKVDMGGVARTMGTLSGGAHRYFDWRRLLSAANAGIGHPAWRPLNHRGRSYIMPASSFAL